MKNKLRCAINDILSGIVQKIKEDNRIFILLFLIFVIFLSGFLCFGPKPALVGDGGEYLGMTCSLYDHHTPDLRTEDIIFRQEIVDLNKIYFPANLIYSGYVRSEDRGWYSIHFWFYPLCCLPAFTVLHFFNFNVLRCFQITNLILILLPLIFIVFHKRISNFEKIWLFAFAAINPVLFYVNWSHPEIFSYTFVLLAILFHLNGNNKIAVFMSSIASLQNPPIIVFTLFLIMLGLKKESWKLKEFGLLLLSASVTGIPFLFYYIKFKTFSLVTLSGAASVSYISVDKIISLFFDLNFGLFPYFPVLLIFSIVCLFMSLLKKNFFIPILWSILCLMAVVCSTQANWNGGMMFINRYDIYMIPILILIAIYSIKFYAKMTISIIFIFSLLVTGCITGILLPSTDYGNYLKFNYLSNTAMVVFPSSYNPPFAVFAERSIHAETDYYKDFPIIYSYDNHPRKILTDYQNALKIEYLINPLYKQKILDNIKQQKIGYINSDDFIFDIPINISKIQISILDQHG